MLAGTDRMIYLLYQAMNSRGLLRRMLCAPWNPPA